MDALALRDESAETLAFEYAHLFSNTPLLGKGSGAQIGFEKTDSGLLTGGVARIDTGLYLNLIFFSDTLEGFANGGLTGWFPGAQSRELAEEVDRRIDEACEAARAETDFREGITLLVGCGIGRAIVDFTSDRQWEDWRFEFVGASDLITLSWLPDFTPLSLWRLLEGQHRVEQAGVELHNINGLLNMVGWARSLGGHLVPHGDLPDEFGDGNIPTFIMIEQNALLQVRYEVATYWDHHVVQNILGRWIGVRKDGGSLFREDQQLPFFMAEERDGSRWLRGVYETVSRTWWCELETPDGTPGHQAYERSKLLKTWMCRIVPVLETAFPELPTGTLLWRSRFEGNIGDWGEKGARSRLTFDDAKSTISVEVDKASRIVSVVADALFEDAIFHPENIAERALVTGAVEGFARLASAKPSADRNDELVQKIAGDVSARQSHAFRAQQFRDFVRDSVWRAPITVDKDDAAILKLGVGWRARRRELGGDIRGKDECTIFLNEIVCLLEDEICEELRSLNRTSVLQFVVMNHESAINDRENWRRTAAAVIALHDDKEAVLQTFAKHESELNPVFQASRLLIEFALCECPVDSRRDPGLRDMSRLMAKVLMVPGIGGWSDAIRWDAMEPRVRITALGDIHADVTFHDAILKPYSRMGVDINVREAIESYAENIEGPNTPQADVSTLAPEFLEAIRQEFGASLDDILKFVDHVEEIGLKANRAIVFVKRSALVEMPGAQPEHVTSLVGFLTFKSRLRWREVPVGYEDRDLFPWRFRRRLSVLRKPLLQIDEHDDPTILVAPGMLVDALGYMISNYHRGDFPRRQLTPKMKQWAGRSRNKIGREFSHTVAKRMVALGWTTETEVSVTKLLRKGFEQNFGDVDVLAWRDDTRRVLLIECKDVHYSKNDREVAEQLADFRGEITPDGKPDLLLRHLNRIKVISAHQKEVKKYVGFAGEPRIEGCLVFKNPVPMKFAWERMKDRVGLHLLAELDKL